MQHIEFRFINKVVCSSADT